MTEENLRRWAKNPMFLVSPRKPCEVFISLAQPDGRMKQPNGEYLKFPYVELIHTACFTVY